MDCIRISNLEVFGNHGVYKEENILGQKFIVSADMHVDTRKAGLTDDLELSVNYGEVCNFINDFMRENTFSLIEAVTENMAKEILLKYRKIKSITLEVKKPWAPVKLPLDQVSVRIERGWHDAFIALGSNMGDKKKYLDDAVKGLQDNESIDLVKCSEYMVTKPYGYTDQEDFLNGAVRINTLLTPYELLDYLHELEQAADRKRDIHWGPRTLDLDILFYDDLVVDSAELIIPHPDMKNRDFVLKPLSELAPYYRHPITNKTVKEMLDEL